MFEYEKQKIKNFKLNDKIKKKIYKKTRIKITNQKN